MLEQNKVYLGDCLELMKEIDDKSISMILCDLPYEKTSCKWDTLIPFEPLWKEYERIIKDNGAIVLFGSQPFTSLLIMSNPKLFRYELIWDKVNRYTGYANANKMPLKRHENICVFYKKLPVYNKQYREGKPYKTKRAKNKEEYMGENGLTDRIIINDGRHNPCSIIQIKGDNKKESGLHPCQKPEGLYKYLLLTFSNENDLILDNCCGSGTIGVASTIGRNYIAIEKDERYWKIACERAEKFKAS